MIGFGVYFANELTVCGRVLSRVMPLLYTVEEILVRMICELRRGITKALNYFTMLCTIRRLAYTSLSKSNGRANGDFVERGNLELLMLREHMSVPFVLITRVNLMYSKCCGRVSVH
jgi:hypothetical protein